MSVLILLGAVLANVRFSDAASAAYPLRIKVLSAQTHAVQAEAQVPRDCDLSNYSAYCNGSRVPSSQSTMLVQDADGRSFWIACTVDSRWSKCSTLPAGQTFDARKQKRGITIVYWNKRGKEIKQVYQLLSVADPVAASASSVAGNVTDNSEGETQAQAGAPRNSTSPGPGWVPTGASEKARSERIRSNFSSTPSGAEISLDGRYVGNTPSEIGLSAGTHVVVFTMPGFEQWRREITIAADSAVNVSASLIKAQP